MVQLPSDGKLPEVINEVFKSYGWARTLNRFGVIEQCLGRQALFRRLNVQGGPSDQLQRIGGMGGRGKLSKLWTEVRTGAGAWAKAVATQKPPTKRKRRKKRNIALLLFNST